MSTPTMLLAPCVLLLCIAAPRTVAGSQAVELGRECRTRHGAVACVDHHAARIGAEVLAEGGNAVDAAVAVAFALAVTHPAAGNLGGGGFLLFSRAGGESFGIDYREVAPRAADERMFLDAAGSIDDARAGIGHFVVGVPGTVAGLELAHQRFGSLPWSRLVAPARRLAEQGIEVDADLAAGLAENAERLARYRASARCFLHEGGRPYVQGEVLRQPDLANTLRWVEEGGAEAFYRGPVAALLDAEMRREHALLTAQDLAEYRAEMREPVRIPFRGKEVIAMPPPSSGGVVLAEVLGILERRGPFPEGPDSPRFRHEFAEAQRRAFADRAMYLGDPRSMSVDLAALLAPEHLAELASSVDPHRATPSDALGPPRSDREGEHTTHFSVIDAAGNAVANTYTLEESFGSKVVAEGTGFLLNNELHDFNLKPGLTDAKGRIGTDPNLPRPGRRPLSSMTPTIVRGERGVELVTGSPGGRTILNTVLCVLVRVLEFGQPLDQAVAGPRQHHQWFPDELRLEAWPAAEPDTALVQALEALGHRVKTLARQGDAHSIAVDVDGEQWAVADRRIDGWVAAPRTPPKSR